MAKKKIVAHVAAPVPPVKRVLAWWDRERRTLPWRAERGVRVDPYAVWLSEILLQQTTVQAAAPYFERFLARWPDVASLAGADFAEIANEFAGLGYYSRARNLHACAKAVAAARGFPGDVEGLLKLPGVGAYTARAIAAIAFGKPCVPVDGNISRIFCRFFGIAAPLGADKARFAALAETWTTRGRPGDLAQALMDLGATICRPAAPRCGACPLQGECTGAAGDPMAFPLKAARKAKPIRHGVAYFAQDAAGRFLARRRPDKGLLSGTLELPGDLTLTGHDGLDPSRHAPFAADWRAAPGIVEQAFTHFTLRLMVFRARLPSGFAAPEGFVRLPAEAAAIRTLSSAMAKAARLGLL